MDQSLPSSETTRQNCNREVAEALEEVSSLLKSRADNPFRVAAYRAAGETIRSLTQPLSEVLDSQGTAGLRALPGVGESIANSIERFVRTGRLEVLQRLRETQTTERQLTSLPGIGNELADRIRQNLGVDTLEDLEVAAYDGRLAAVPGIGRKRLQALRESLSLRLRRGPQAARAQARRPPDEPPVADLLAVDRRYREYAEQGRLPHAAPRRFNPTQTAWLPILRVERGGRHFTAMFSNTARVHQMRRVLDWVVLYRDDAGGYGQWTVITSRYGPLRGRRIVRGREAECGQHYRGPQQQSLFGAGQGSQPVE